MSSNAILIVTGIRFEHYRSQYTLGCAETRPRLSWEVLGQNLGLSQQKAFEAELYNFPSHEPNIGNDCDQNRQLIARTTVDSSDSILVSWPFDQELKSRQRIGVRVKVQVDASWSDWSSVFTYEVGLLHRRDWQAQRVMASAYDKTANTAQPEQLLRKDFSTHPNAAIAQARLYVVAQGVYEAHVNGKRINDNFLAPGWTKYDKHIRCQTYDVTALISPSSSSNCVAISLAEGWYCGLLGFFGGRRNIWGPYPAAMAQLEIYYEGGDSKTMLASDSSWISCLGPSRRAELYHGEKYDATLEVEGWSDPASDTPKQPWQPVDVLEPLPMKANIVNAWGEPARRIQTIYPVAIMETPAKKTVVDFGQNLVGYVRLKNIQAAPKGHKISLWHAEALENGELARRPLRAAEALDEYVCKGYSEGESWEPRFTFHGFRYCQIDGWSQNTKTLLDSVEAVVCHTDMEVAGDFHCSDPLINQLYHNAVWSMKGNFLHIPTDCPQRDERLGWTGDIALFAPTATKMFDCFGMLRDWMVDVQYDQMERGGIPALVTPNVIVDAGVWSSVRPIAIWHDVVILVPWALYQNSGDKIILQEHYGNMKAWLEMIPTDKKRNRVLWDPDTFQLGDWLDPSASPHEPMSGQTDRTLVADAFLVNSFTIMAQVAEMLKDSDGAQIFLDKATKAREQFAEEYITESGRLVSDSQTAYALALSFDLLKPSQKRTAGDRLANIVRCNQFKIGTGFAGTPYILDALTHSGHSNVAYAMLQCQECPSWLYPITLGATTMWERWDSMLPDGKVNPGEMTSFNHYTFGSVASFLHQTLAGLQAVEPGWKKSRAAPMPGGGFLEAKAEHKSPYGLVSCAWVIENGILEVHVVVPNFTSMEVVLPQGSGNARTQMVGAGEWSFKEAWHDDQNWPVAAIPAFPE